MPGYTINVFSPSHLEKACQIYNDNHDDDVTLTDINTFLAMALNDRLSEQNKKKYYFVIDSSRKMQEEEFNNRVFFP
jgi:hypothetical protein